MPVARFEMPDGRIARFEVPEGTTPEQAQTMISQQLAPKHEVNPPQESIAAARAPVASSIKDAVGGFARSGMGIASNLMRPIEALIPGGEDFDSGHKQRMERVSQRFHKQGYDQNSLAFQGGKLAGEVVATAPVGGALAKVASKVPMLTRAVPGIDTALRTGGFRLNAPAATTAGQVVRNIGTRVGAGAATGAATAGAVDFDHTGTGALIGGVLPPAVTTAGTAGRMVKSAVIDPLVNHNAIIGKTLARMVGSDNIGNLARGQLVTPRTPGVQFSVGQQTGNPAINALEDTLRQTNPGGLLNETALHNNTALANTLRNIGRDDIALESAKQARSTAAAPMYHAARQSTNLADPTRTVNLIDRIVSANPANKALTGPLNEIRSSLFEAYPATQRGSDAWKVIDGALGGRMSAADSSALRAARVVMDRMRKGTIDAAEATKQLRGIKVTSKTASDAINTAKQYVKTPDNVVMQEPHKIISAIDNIKAMIGKPDNSFVVSQLNTVKKSLEHQLGKAAPEFRQAEQAFAQGSRPINQMQVGQLLSNKLIPSTAGDMPSRLNAASLASAMRNPNQVAKTATGFKRARLDRVMEPDQLAAIQGVTSDASRIADMASLGAGQGSATARRQALGNFVGENLGAEFPFAGRVIGALGNVPGVNIPLRAVGTAANALGGNINNKIAAELETMLASNPQLVRQLLLQAQQEAARQSGQIPSVLSNPLLRSGLLNMGVTSTSR